MTDVESGFEHYANQISVDLNEVSTKVGTIRRLADRIKQKQSDPRNASKRQELEKLKGEIINKLGTMRNDIEELQKWDRNRLSPTQKLTRTKLTSQYDDLGDDFKALLLSLKSVEQSSVPPAASAVTESTAMINDNDGSYGTVQTSTQISALADQSQVDFQQSVSYEREGEVSLIHQGVQEINSIFKDLGTMIHEQGEQVDYVENHISDMRENVVQGDQQLTKRDNTLRARRKCTCIFLLVLVIVLVIVLGVVS